MNNGISYKKIYSILLFYTIALLVILSRLIQLQIYLSDTFATKSEKNFLRIEKTAPTRGNILDRKGNLIATNRPIHNIYWQGSGDPHLKNNKYEVLQLIEKIIDKRITSDQKMLSKIKKAERFHKKILLSSDITFEELSKIEEQLSEENSIIVSTSFKRFYPYQSCASHILGYLGRINIAQTGKMGLEKLFEDILKGKSGSLITTINSLGKKLSETPLEQALAGKNIKTTLDIDLQKIIESTFPKNETGTSILMDPHDGSIVAMVSKPNFDPNIFLSPISKTDWDDLQENHPFLNRAFNACYPPGSIFKLITASAALEQNIIDLQQEWDCKGYVYFGKRKYLCHNLSGHGKMTASIALEQSCNTFFYDIGTKIEIDTLADYAKRFGLGKKTGIIFPEKKGIVPSSAWKLEKKGEPWWPGETLSAVIGQSFLSTTPIQIACMISSIFTGYLTKPRILADEPILKELLRIEPEILEFLKQSMKKVATQGTGKNISRVKNIEIYAKTSTAQTSALYKRKLGEKYREHRWFVTYFQYKQAKPLTLVILVEHSESAISAKLAAVKFLTEYKRLVDREGQCDTIACDGDI